MEEREEHEIYINFFLWRIISSTNLNKHYLTFHTRALELTMIEIIKLILLIGFLKV